MLSIIVPWRNRAELGEPLAGFREAARQLHGEVVLVNFSGNEAALQAMLPEERSHLRVVHVSDEPYFNKSAAHNVGAGHAKGSLFFFCDCDVLVSAEVIDALKARVLERPGLFGTLAGIKESQTNARQAGFVTSFGYTLHIRTVEGAALEIVDSEEDAKTGERQAPGLLMVRRSDFGSVQGYNSQLVGWGWEDQDMIGRLTLGSRLQRVTCGHAIHLSHDDEARTGQYPIINRWESRDKMFREALSRWDQGNFMGTLDADLERRSVRSDGPRAELR